MPAPRFSIVTPSLRQLPWLQRAMRSVADQPVTYEHIVQDAGTGAELDAWVERQPHARLFVERDAGMYDALNRGFARATGEIYAYLNCDEQYLPGALTLISQAFERCPEVDLIAGDYLILEADGTLQSQHRATPLRRAMILTDHLYNYSCGLFFRRSLWERLPRFETTLRAAGDAEWVCRALQAGIKDACLRQFTSTFSLTGQNLGAQPKAREEGDALRALAPAWARGLAPVLRQFRHLEKLARGGYSAAPVTYEIYLEGGSMRTLYKDQRPAYRVRSRF